MYHAHTAALQSSCLSRQVGAALIHTDGTVVSTGTNDVPKYGGGVYDEDTNPDYRCSKWEWTDGVINFRGCHNQRKKNELKSEIAKWLADEFVTEVTTKIFPESGDKIDFDQFERHKVGDALKEALSNSTDRLEFMPGVGNLIEFSRSVHAEMNALLSATRNGVSSVGTKMYCTTYPCHSCARHLVTAGIKEVRYIEPYVKSLAFELNYDSIETDSAMNSKEAAIGKDKRMVIAPFTGVGPRMYDDYFKKRGELKNPDGSYLPPNSNGPIHAVRLNELRMVEEHAASTLE